MLALDRKRGESVIIFTTSDGPIEVKISDNRRRGDRIQLLFDAPKGVPIWRKELTCTEGELCIVPKTTTTESA